MTQAAAVLAGAIHSTLGTIPGHPCEATHSKFFPALHRVYVRCMPIEDLLLHDGCTELLSGIKLQALINKGSELLRQLLLWPNEQWRILGSSCMGSHAALAVAPKATSLGTPFAQWDGRSNVASHPLRSSSVKHSGKSLPSCMSVLLLDGVSDCGLLHSNCMSALPTGL